MVLEQIIYFLQDIAWIDLIINRLEDEIILVEDLDIAKELPYLLTTIDEMLVNREGNQYHEVLPSCYNRNQTWSALHKAWIGYQ